MLISEVGNDLAGSVVMRFSFNVATKASSVFVYFFSFWIWFISTTHLLKFAASHHSRTEINNGDLRSKAHGGKDS